MLTLLYHEGTRFVLQDGMAIVCGSRAHLEKEAIAEVSMECMYMYCNEINCGIQSTCTKCIIT